MRRTLPLLLLPLLAACSAGGTDSDKGLLDPLAGQPLVAGEGWGSLRLGETTLSRFVEKYGTGRPSVVASDEIGIELGFRDNQVGFLFLAEGECDGKIRFVASRLLPLLAQGMKEFFAQYPECREMPLHSASVWAGTSKEDSFYQGKTADGAGLFDPPEAVRASAPPDPVARMVAGSRPEDLESLRFAGIWYEYEAGPEPLIRHIVIFRPGP